ncbi:MAG: acetate--CoA ligase family protein [Chloroflexota bacterium]
MNGTHSLKYFLAPRGVAVVGASNNPAKLGYRLADNLVRSGYRGAIHFVNPKGGSLLERPVYPSLDAVPDPVDLAALLIPAEATSEALRQCGQRGIACAIVLSGGFRETGPAGEALERECLQVARQMGIRLLGPNGVGVIDTHTPLNATFLPPPGPLPGEVAMLSHSGAICDIVIDWSRTQGLGLSQLISLGNQADVTETDFLPILANDPDTHVIGLYLEGLQDGRRFVQEARRAARRKPLVAIKVGHSASGQRAASSHTGALAGQDHAFSAAFRRAGILRATSDEELITWLTALAWSPLPAGRSVAVLTNAGGPGVIASDTIEAHSLQLADLSAATQAGLAHGLPHAASLANPVDMLGSATPAQYAACLRLLLDDANVHAVLCILPPPPVGDPESFAAAMIGVLQSGADKPVVVALMGGESLAEAARRFRAARIPNYPYAEQAVSALAVLARRTEILQESETPAPELPGLNPKSVREALAAEALEPAHIVAAYGIQIPSQQLATSPGEAAALAVAMGFPVALKVVSPGITHKSDAGGVLLGINDISEVDSGYTQIVTNARRAQPEANLAGVLVQKMIPPGQEVIVGMVRDPQFGPLLMFGSGGTEVEGLGDVTFELAPLDRPQAAAMLERTWAGRKLRGYRNLPPADGEAVIDAILRLSQLALDFPEIEEIEINPLRVLAKGAVAVDVRGKAQ